MTAADWAILVPAVAAFLTAAAAWLRVRAHVGNTGAHRQLKAPRHD